MNSKESGIPMGCLCTEYETADECQWREDGYENCPNQERYLADMRHMMKRDEE